MTDENENETETRPNADPRFVEWSRRIRASDQNALAELFRACCGDLRRYVRSFGIDGPTADDLVQESFVRLWDRRRSIDTKRSLRAYLFVTIKNLAINADRRIRTRRRVHASLADAAGASAETPAEASAREANPDDMADADLLQSHLNAWIHDLPERRREAFVLSRYGGLSLNEIAAVMNISAKTVEQHITHALKELRRRLHELDPDLLNP